MDSEVGIENLVLGDAVELLFDPVEVTKTFENAGQVTRIQAGVCRLRGN